MCAFRMNPRTDSLNGEKEALSQEEALAGKVIEVWNKTHSEAQDNKQMSVASKRLLLLIGRGERRNLLGCAMICWISFHRDTGDYGRDSEGQNWNSCCCNEQEVNKRGVQAQRELSTPLCATEYEVGLVKGYPCHNCWKEKRRSSLSGGFRFPDGH